jgi:hypothetical protein
VQVSKHPAFQMNSSGLSTLSLLVASVRRKIALNLDFAGIL